LYTTSDGVLLKEIADEFEACFLPENEAPTAWYNIQADLPEPVPPPLNPATNGPIGPADLQPIFADEPIAQEVTQERWVEIPQEIRDIYAMWRPSPPVRATGLEKVLGTPARIYFKVFDDSPDVVIGCCGGGSSFAGLAFPFLRHKLAGKIFKHRPGAAFPLESPVPPGRISSFRGNQLSYPFPAI